MENNILFVLLEVASGLVIGTVSSLSKKKLMLSAGLSFLLASRAHCSGELDMLRNWQRDRKIYELI